VPRHLLLCICYRSGHLGLHTFKNEKAHFA
jgi:hypothetical protein